MSKFKYILIEILLFVAIGLALVWVVTGDAEAKDKAEKSIKLTQAEADQCSAGGGCILITKRESEKIIELMTELEQAAKSSCRSI